MKNTTNDKIKTSWRDVTINEFFELRNKLNESDSYYEKEIIKIAFIFGISEDDVWNMKISDVKLCQSKTQWMNDFEISKNVKFKNINIDDHSYSINADMHSFTVAQYIDFQNFFPKRMEKTNYIGNILACFIIPKGKTYGEGYDVAKLVEIINDNVDILTANEIIFFFLKQYLYSMKVMLTYFKLQMKILKILKRKKHKEEIEKLEQKVQEMEKNILAGLPLLTTSQN